MADGQGGVRIKLSASAFAWLVLCGLVASAAAVLVLESGPARHEAAAQDDEVLLGPLYGKSFKIVAEAPEKACQQISGPLGQMEWSDRGATDQGLLSLGLVSKTGAIPLTISGAADCSWAAVGSGFEAPSSGSYEVGFVMDVSGAVVLNGLASVGCDAERAGVQLFAFLWDQESGEVVSSRAIPLPEVEKPTLDHNGCSGQQAVAGLFEVLAGALDGVTKELELDDSAVALEDLGHDGDMVGAEDLLGQLSSWPAVQRIGKQGYEFSLEGPVQLESGKSYGVGVGLFGFAMSLTSAATGAGYATVLFEAGSYELYDWPTNFKIEIGPTRLVGVRIAPEGSEKPAATPSPSATAVPRSPTPSPASEGADVFVTKLDSPDPVVSGEEITYTLLVVNSGSVAATDVRVDDELPSGAVFVSASPGCSEGSTVSCDIGSLAPGDTHRLTITVTAPTVASQTSIKNCAVAQADNDENPDNNDHCQWTSVGPPSSGGTPTPEATPEPTPEPTESPAPSSPTPESPTPEPTPTCRPAPSNLTADMHWSGGAAWVDLRWTDNSGDEEGFRIERATSADGSYSVIATLGSSATAWTDQTPAYGPDNYYYRVTAYGMQCDSSPSNVASVAGRWPMPTSPPACVDVGAPSGMMVARQYPSDGRYFVDLQWQDNATNEAGFLVQRASALEGPWGYAASLGPDIPRFTDELPSGPSIWYYRVLAVGTGPCHSAPSNVVAASVQ